MDVNVIYDALVKVKLVELVLKAEGMSTEDIQKVKDALEKKVKEKGL